MAFYVNEYAICFDPAVVLYFGAISPYSSVDRAVVS